MKKIWGIICLSVLAACAAEEENIYDYIEICQNDFYQQYGISATDTLNQFEQRLIQEGLLKDASYSSYKELLHTLSSEVYFDAYPFEIKSNAPLLTLNPDRLDVCLERNYGIDSTALTQLPYYELQIDLQAYYSSSENLHVSGIFQRYLKHINAEEFQHPFIRLELQKLLYRWYFESKQQKAL